MCLPSVRKYIKKKWIISRLGFLLKIELVIVRVNQGIRKFLSAKYIGPGILFEALYWDNGKRRNKKTGFKIPFVLFN